MGQRYGAVLQEVQLHTLTGIRVVDCNGIVVASTAGDIGGHEFKTPLTGIRGAIELLRDLAHELTASACRSCARCLPRTVPASASSRTGRVRASM
jgi:signal transduction histidine kinase